MEGFTDSVFTLCDLYVSKEKEYGDSPGIPLSPDGKGTLTEGRTGRNRVLKSFTSYRSCEYQGLSRDPSRSLLNK